MSTTRRSRASRRGCESSKNPTASANKALKNAPSDFPSRSSPDLVSESQLHSAYHPIQQVDEPGKYDLVKKDRVNKSSESYSQDLSQYGMVSMAGASQYRDPFAIQTSPDSSTIPLSDLSRYSSQHSTRNNMTEYVYAEKHRNGHQTREQEWHFEEEVSQESVDSLYANGYAEDCMGDRQDHNIGPGAESQMENIDSDSIRGTLSGAQQVPDLNSHSSEVEQDDQNRGISSNSPPVSTNESRYDSTALSGSNRHRKQRSHTKPQRPNGKRNIATEHHIYRSREKYRVSTTETNCTGDGSLLPAGQPVGSSSTYPYRHSLQSYGQHTSKYQQVASNYHQSSHENIPSPSELAENETLGHFAELSIPGEASVIECEILTSSNALSWARAQPAREIRNTEGTPYREGYNEEHQLESCQYHDDSPPRPRDGTPETDLAIDPNIDPVAAMSEDPQAPKIERGYAKYAQSYTDKNRRDGDPSCVEEPGFDPGLRGAYDYKHQAEDNTDAEELVRRVPLREVNNDGLMDRTKITIIIERQGTTRVVRFIAPQHGQIEPKLLMTFSEANFRSSSTMTTTHSTRNSRHSGRSSKSSSKGSSTHHEASSSGTSQSIQFSSRHGSSRPPDPDCDMSEQITTALKKVIDSEEVKHARKEFVLPFHGNATEKEKNAIKEEIIRAGVGSGSNDHIKMVSSTETAAATVIKSLHTDSLITEERNENVLICHVEEEHTDVTTYSVAGIAHKELVTGGGVQCGPSVIDQEFLNWMRITFRTSFEVLTEKERGRGSRFMTKFQSYKAGFDTTSCNAEYEILLKMRNVSRDCLYYSHERQTVKIYRRDMLRFFQPLVEGIEGLLGYQKASTQHAMHKIEKVVLTGKLSECPYLRTTITKWSEAERVEFISFGKNSQENGSVVSEGIKLREYESMKPSEVKSRVHYGYHVAELFREGYDPRRSKIVSVYDDLDYCDDRILWIVRKGDSLRDREAFETNRVFHFDEGTTPVREVNLVSCDQIDAPEWFGYGTKVQKVGTITTKFSKREVQRRYFQSARTDKRAWSVPFELHAVLHSEEGVLRFRAIHEEREIGKTTIKYESGA